MSNKTHTIVVLSDGQTWNTLSGCSILVIDDKQFDDLCNDRIDAGDLTPITEIGLADQTPPAYDEEIDLDASERTHMTNKEYAIKQLQELPADEDAVIIIFTKADAEAAIEHEGLKVTAEAWNDIIRDCGKVFPSSEMWDTFNDIAVQNGATQEND